jgi:hypothetical protein
MQSLFANFTVTPYADEDAEPGEYDEEDFEAIPEDEEADEEFDDYLSEDEEEDEDAEEDKANFGYNAVEEGNEDDSPVLRIRIPSFLSNQDH